MDTATSLRLCGVTDVRREDLLVAYLDRLRRAAPRLGRAAARRWTSCAGSTAPLCVTIGAGRAGAPALGCRRARPRGGRRRLGPAGGRRAGRPAGPRRRVTSSTSGRGPEGAVPVSHPRPIRGLPPPPRRHDRRCRDPMPPEVEPPRPRRRRRRRAGCWASRAACGAGRSVPAPRSRCSVPASSGTPWASPTSATRTTVFTDADLQALRSVVGMVREGVLRRDVPRCR